MIVEIADLGTWAGASLLSEYDPIGDVIRIDARAIETIRATLGPIEADRFVAVATAHERFHRMHPRGTESEAHAYAHAACGIDPARYERVLRAARRMAP